MGGPFAKPWILLADYREAHDILGRRTAPVSRGGGVTDDFDKSTFITNSMSCLGEFHAAMRATTRGDRFKSSRALIQNLMAPAFLHGVMGHAVHRKGMELVRLLEVKMRLAGGRPFNIKTDLDYVALDVILDFAFAGNFDQRSLGPQIEVVSRLCASDVPEGLIDEPVTFPEAPVGAFIDAVRIVPTVVERYIASLLPGLGLWWWKKQPWYKKSFLQKHQVFREQFAKTHGNTRGGHTQSAAKHMLMREGRDAEKQGCTSLYVIDILIDEVSFIIPLFAPAPRTLC